MRRGTTIAGKDPPGSSATGCLVSDELMRRGDRLLERRRKQAQFRDPQRTLDNFDFNFNKKLDEGMDPFSWALSDNGRGIYFISITSAIEGVDRHDPTVTTPLQPKCNLEFFEFATGKRNLIYTVDRSGNMGLAVSPDGKSILFVRNDLWDSIIMLVRNFH